MLGRQFFKLSTYFSYPMTSLAAWTSAMVVVISCLFNTSPAQAAGHADYSATALGRLSPVGLSAEGTAGYLLPIWGEAGGENPFWGYVRPSVTARGLAIPTLRTSLDIYPLSFFGYTGGRTISRQLLDQPGFDCEATECKVEINSWYWQARLMGKYKKLGAILLYERTDYDDHDHLHKLIGDETNVVFLSPLNEVGELRAVTLNYEFIKELNFGLRAEDFKTDKTDDCSRQQILYGRYSLNSWVYTLGLGRTDTTQRGVSAQAILAITWIGKNKIAP